MRRMTIAELEAEAGNDKDQAEDQDHLGAHTLVGQPGELGDLEGAGGAVEHRHAVEQHAGGDRAEHEILHRGFGRAHRVALQRNH